MLDNPIRFSAVELKSAFSNVDEIIHECVIIGDPRKAIELGKSIIRDGALRGLALARLLFKLSDEWKNFARTDDDFYAVVETEMGYGPATVDKYMRMWEAIFENGNISDETKAILSGRPMRDLLLLTAAAREGSLDDEQLRDAATSPDRDSLKNAIREARGHRTSSESAIILMINMREGTNIPIGVLWAKQGDKRVKIGILDVDSTEEITEKAVARIINAVGIMEVK